jgi:hypothetical protein
MCLACEEEAFYRAYLDHMDKKAKEAAAADSAAKRPDVCDDVKERAQVGSTRLADSKMLISGKPEISVREAGGKQ